MIEENSFIVYEEKGVSDLDKLSLESVLSRCAFDYKIVKESDGVISFEKIVKKDSDLLDSPHLVGHTMSMNTYNLEEMKSFSVLNGFDSIEDKKIIDILYSVKDMNMFNMFADSVSFNAVFYDKEKGDLLVINGKDFRLFYGYSRINDSIMFSNNYEVLSSLVPKVLEMDSDCVYYNGEFISLSDSKRLVLR